MWYLRKLRNSDIVDSNSSVEEGSLIFGLGLGLRVTLNQKKDHHLAM